ncbi:MAG: 6-bladed beta-propeller, partial [Bacillota bacterium]
MAAQMVHEPRMLAAVRWSSFQWSLLGRTLAYNAGVGMLATGMGLPAAIVIGRGRGVLAGGLSLMLPLVLLMPSIVYTYGWMQVMRLMGLALTPAGLADVLRCVWVLASWLWALPAITIGLSLRMTDSQVQQQALLDGALWRVTWRQLAGPILASFAMVTVLAMQEFVVYEPSGISVIATEIRTVFETGSVGLSSAAITAVEAGAARGPLQQGDRAAAAVATAIPALAIVLALSLLSLWAMRRNAENQSLELQGWPKTLNAGWIALLATGALLVLTLVLPTAAMVVSLKRAVDLVHTWEVLGPQATGSVLIASIAGMMALGIGMLGCMRSSPGLLMVALITFLIGGELLAVADIRIYNRATAWPIAAGLSGNALLGWIYNNWPIMVIAYLGRFAWLALLAGQISWSKPFEELRALSAMDGAGPGQTARHVIWPLAWPILAAAAVLVLLMSMTEVPATVLLSPQRPQMLVPMLMTWVHNLRYDDMLEASLLIMGLVFVLGSAFLVLSWLGIQLGPAIRRLSSRNAVLACVLLLLVGCEKGTQPQAVWCETGTGPAQVVYPRGLCYSKFDDTFYIVDRMARVQHLDRQGQWINEWRMPEWQKGKPVGLSIGPDGNVYIADTHYARVMVYSPKGELLRSWGGEGRGPGQFIYPVDVGFDPAGNIYVSEYGDNDRIQVFDAKGNYLRQFGRFGNGDGEFARPESMVVDDQFV